MKLAELIRTGVANQFVVKRPYMIAEAGVNHEGSMDLAKRLVEEAAEGGAGLRVPDFFGFFRKIVDFSRVLG